MCASTLERIIPNPQSKRIIMPNSNIQSDNESTLLQENDDISSDKNKKKQRQDTINTNQQNDQ